MAAWYMQMWSFRKGEEKEKDGKYPKGPQKISHLDIMKAKQGIEIPKYCVRGLHQKQVKMH